MKTAILIIGVPGTGKTTLTQKLIKFLSEHSESSRIDRGTKLIPFNYYRLKNGSRWKVLGVFNDPPQSYAEGTDKMSMGVQPVFAEWIKTQTANLVIEGDRLGNVKTLRALSELGYNLKVVVLTASDKVLEKRYAKRGSNQSEAFIKGRHTKVSNVVKACEEITAERLHGRNETKVEGSSILNRLALWIINH